MNEIEIAASVLAAMALPLVGIGPMLLRTLRPLLFGVAMVAGAAIVLLLTRAPWAAAFMLCIGAALLWRHRQAGARHVADDIALPVAGFAGPRPDSEGDPA